jgi:esterase/lipase
VLLMNGDRDPWVRPEEARAIFDGLAGDKTLKFFEGVAHDSCLRHRPREWQSTVSGFLDKVLGR